MDDEMQIRYERVRIGLLDKDFCSEISGYSSPVKQAFRYREKD
ncbi:MAG: hypothetical protein QXZ17_04895 [Nitrososphaerota archaeon]